MSVPYRQRMREVALMAQAFEDLEVWRDSRRLARLVYEVTGQGSLRHDWDLRRQMRRSAVSVMSNIAEGFDRGTNRDFARFLHVAKGSVSELRAQLYLAQDLGYAEREQLTVLLAGYDALGRRISGLVAYLERCISQGRVLRETEIGYTTARPESTHPDQVLDSVQPGWSSDACD